MSLPAVLIVSDIRLYLEGLVQFLERDGRLAIAGAYAGTEEAIEALQEMMADAVLVDIGMREALDFVRRVADRFPDTKILALGLTEVENEILACAEAGVVGYVCREGSTDDVVKAVLSALKEELRCSRRIAAALLRRVARLAREVPDVSTLPLLTPREREVAELLYRGLTNKEIGSALHIEVSTVKNHVHSVFEKLDARTRAEAGAKYHALTARPSWRDATGAAGARTLSP